MVRDSTLPFASEDGVYPQNGCLMGEIMIKQWIQGKPISRKMWETKTLRLNETRQHMARLWVSTEDWQTALEDPIYRYL